MWMNLENIILSERSQTQKATKCIILFIWNFQTGKFIETESRLMVAWDSGKGEEWEVTASGYGVSSWGDESILKLDSSDDYTLCE